MNEQELLLVIENNWLFLKIGFALGAGIGAGLATWVGIGWLSNKLPKEKEEN